MPRTSKPWDVPRDLRYRLLDDDDRLGLEKRKSELMRLLKVRTYLDAIGTTGCKATVNTIQPSNSVVD